MTSPWTQPIPRAFRNTNTLNATRCTTMLRLASSFGTARPQQTTDLCFIQWRFHSAMVSKAKIERSGACPQYQGTIQMLEPNPHCPKAPASDVQHCSFWARLGRRRAMPGDSVNHTTKSGILTIHANAKRVTSEIRVTMLSADQSIIDGSGWGGSIPGWSC